MAKCKTQAQALAQKQAAISSTESFQLVQCLVRVSVYHVCWMRGLFPEESFSGHELSQLDKMHIKVLRPKEGDEEAATLQQWVEQGVMHAVKHGYLKNMYFGIAQDAAATHLLEEYIYSFKYGENGISFQVNASSRGNTKDKYNTTDTKNAPPNVDVVRYQVVRLMRMLVQVCQTLDQVPDERYLFIKLTYHDHTPEDYEPPFFHGVKEDGIGHFSRRPFSMDVGTMDTRHHTVSVRIKSVLDSCDDKEADDADMQELEASQQITGMLDGLMDADEPGLNPEEAGVDHAVAEDEAPADQRTDDAMRMLVASQALDANEDMPLEPTLVEDPTLAPQSFGASPGSEADAAAAPTDSADVTEASEGGEGGDEMCAEAGSPAPSPGSSGQAYEAVRRYCLGRAEVNFLDVMAVFYELPPSQLTLVFDGLHREGLLQAGADKDTYLVAQQAQAPAAGSGSGKCDDSRPQKGSQADGDEAMMDVDTATAIEAAGDTSWQGKDQAQQQQEQQISQMMTGLSMDASRAAGAARGLATGAAAAVNASILGREVQAGSLVSGLPGQPKGLQAPTAAANQVDPAAADEPSVQQDGADQQPIWFDASQQSLAKIPSKNTTADKDAEKAHPSKPSRLRKASYVDKPIYQNSKQHSSGGKHTAEKEEQQQLRVAAGVQKPRASKGAGRKSAAGTKGTPMRASRLSGMK